MSFEWIDDIIRFVNLRNAIDDDETPFYSAPPDAYDDTMISDDGDDVVVNFGF